jgi:hypothetical protein
MAGKGSWAARLLAGWLAGIIIHPSLLSAQVLLLLLSHVVLPSSL